MKSMIFPRGEREKEDVKKVQETKEIFEKEKVLTKKQTYEREENTEEKGKRFRKLRGEK
jgi:hypothetical protein